MRFLLASILLVAACGKGKPTQSNDKPVPAGSDVASGSAPAKGETPDVVLPSQTGQPPEKTAAPLNEAQHDKLGDMQFPGWERKLMEVNDKVALWRYTTKTGVKLTVTMMIRVCSDKTPCQPIDIEVWKKDDAFREHIIGKDLVGDPNTKFEIAPAELGGTPLISTFVLGQSFKKDDQGNTPGTYKYAYGLFWNDGKNSIQAIASYADVPMKDPADMVAAIPREHLEQSARAFMDHFSHEWQKL